MFARHLSIDEWRDRANYGTSIVNPTWDQVQEAVRALDGERRTMVCLSDKEGDSDQVMFIAGPHDDRFLVNATLDNVDFFSLVDPSRSSDKITLYVGGQNSEYEDNKCVPLAWTLQAAKIFYESGQLDPSLNWQSDY